MYWFHPGVWWVAGRLRVERELACDDRVIETGTAAREYATHLLEIAYSIGGHRTPPLAVSMARRRQLEGRMLAALDAAQNRSVPTFRYRLAATVTAAALVCPLAAAAPAIVAVDPPAPSVSSLTTSVAALAQPSNEAPFSLSRAALGAVGNAQDFGTWEIRPTGTEGTVHLRLVELNSSSGTNVPIAALEGLTAAQLSGPAGPVQFRVRRDAGTFAFEGVIRNGVGAGTFTFTPDSKFPDELAKRGFARPTAREQYQMARHDIGYAFVDELTRQGYSKPETADLVRAGQHGVDASYLRDMAALGYKLGSLQPLIELRDHGVTPDYVRALSELGYKGLSAEEVRRARDHGITPDYVRAMRDAGYGSLPMDALINARDHGITAEYVRDTRQLGYTLPLNELVRARDHGITVEFVRDMAALGYKGQSMDSLVRVRDHGVAPQYVQELKALGYTNLSLDDLVTLRDHGLTADRIRAANARAGTRLPVDMLKSLAAGGMR
jgi:ribosomal protein L7Ae-like RNA K-turn-binding protein